MPPENDLARLEQATRNDAGNAELHYLLGAELAQAGDYPRAVVEMGRAIELQPELHTARFQLGLLHLTMAEPQHSLAVWAPLEQSGNPALKSFKRGLEALIRDELAACIGFLEAGIAANTVNPPLNRDMRLVIENTRRALQPQPAPAGPQAVRTDFSLYGQSEK